MRRALALLALAGLGWTGAPAEVTALKGARLLLPDGRWVEDGVVLVSEGRFLACGAGVEVPAGAKVTELPPGSVLTPGFIDLHSHLGSAFDVEESTESVTPLVKAVEAFTSRHPDVAAALRSGVTTVAIAPGNGNLVGGRIGLVKLNGGRYDRALFRDEVALKVSLGPEALRRDREPTSKTGAVRMLRDLLVERSKGPPLFIHVNSPGEIQSALELKALVPGKMVLLHAREAGSAFDRLDVPVAFGPLTVADRREILETPGRLARAGAPLAFVSDAPWTSEADLRVTAALAVKHGLDRKTALAALTSTPARLLDLEKELGGLEAGRRADLVAWSGDPLSLASAAVLVMVDGAVVWRKE